jgi:dihydropteroate synthase
MLFFIRGMGIIYCGNYCMTHCFFVMFNTKIMAILNVTPDSFYDKSRYENFQAAIERGLLLQSEGADIIDVGGESSRPGAIPVSEQEELERVLPVIQELKSKTALPLSIDTTKPRVAAAAVKAGASLINDISGFCDPEMIALAAESNCDICLMHMQGMPKTMQLNPHYEEGIVPHLLRWFEEKIHRLIREGIKEEKIILDPGIGFGKTVADNLQIIHNLPQFKQSGFRVLLGISRKSFLGKILNKTPGELLASTIAVNTVAMMSQVDIIRVHDVKEHRDVIEVLRKL